MSKFPTEVASARTFVFVREIEPLLGAGLIKGGDLDNALFVIYSFETNKAELQKQKDRYKNLDRVNWENAAVVSDGEHTARSNNEFAFTDATRKKVVAYEYWGFYDIDNDGTLKPFVATWIGDTMIRMEENPFPDGKIPLDRKSVV